jgi:thioredoxin 1
MRDVALYDEAIAALSRAGSHAALAHLRFRDAQRILTMTSIKTITSSEFESKVLQGQQPVILDFYQATCAPCRVLEPRLEQVAQQYAGRVPVYRIDLERDFSVAERLGVKSIPTVLVFRQGREIERLDGLITEQQLRTAFEQAAT